MILSRFVLLATAGMPPTFDNRSPYDKDTIAFHTFASAAVDLTTIGGGVLQRSVRDIDGSGRRRTFVYNDNVPMEESESVIWRVVSPSARKTAVFRSFGLSSSEKCAILVEVYENGGLVQKIRLPEKLHGNILTDGTFGSPTPWDPTESFLIYPAEQIPHSTCGFFDHSDGATHRGMQNVVGFAKQESFGEKLNDQYPLHGIFVLSLETGIARRIPSGDIVGEPIFLNHNEIVYTGWNDEESPRRLGLLYCQQRPRQLHRVDVSSILTEISEGEIEETQTSPTSQVLTKNFRLAWSPRALPDGRLLFLANKVGFETHVGCFALALLETTGEIRIIVDTVENPFTAQRSTDTVAGMPFPGIFVAGSPAGGISISHDIIFLTIQWGSCTKVVRVSLQTGKIDLLRFKEEMEYSSQTLLSADPFRGCLLTSQSPNKPPTVYRIPADHLSSKDLSFGDEFCQVLPPMAASCVAVAKPLPDILFDFEIVETLVPSLDNPSDQTRLQSLFLTPKNKSKKPPLIVVPHGGPHSVSSTAYLPSTAFLCAHGEYAILLVNYRGSMGFGSSFLNALPTRIGSLDVNDMLAAIESVIFRVDENRVGLCGGSHGGFLTAHLTSQYPSMFRAAALRNPVVDLPAMVATTDIPDWCYVEACKGKHNWDKYRPPSSDELELLYKKSPIKFVDRVKTPTLVALGLEDLRVPPSQGKEWFYALKSNGVEAKMVVYDNDTHALDSAPSEADHWIITKKWFDEHFQ